MSKYERWLEPDGLLMLEGWARDGLTDEQIAGNCGCACSTLYEWKKKHPEIAEALKKGKAVVDIQVENALLKRALGYDYEESRIEMVTGRDGREIVKNVTYRKHSPPNVTAAIFWLKNRMPEKYRVAPMSEIEDTSEIESEIYGD